MRLFALTSILMCLTAACSTTPAVRTEVKVLWPPDGLLKRCVPPKTIPTVTGRDMAANSRERQSAYEKCEARMNCLIEWHALARAAVYSNVTMDGVRVCGQANEPAEPATAAQPQEK